MSQQIELREGFQQRVRRLQRELERAIRHQKPALLLAVYASEWVRAEAERELTRFLRERGQETSLLRVDEAHSDIPALLAAHPAPERTVFFVLGLDWGGGEDGLAAYRALNLRRELFIERRLRVVFWLTEGEAVRLAQHAPDFWAFRHRVVEFVEPPEVPHRAAIARELAWLDWGDRTLREDTEAKIRLRESLLADLPEGEETRAARADLLYTLGGLYWARGDYEKALNALQASMAAGKEDAAVWNGLGNVYRALGRYEEAIAAYRKAIALDEKYAHPWNGLGNVYRALGRHEDAIAAYRKAIELDEKDANPWNGLGNVYADQGRYEDAIAAYRKAIELDEKDAYPWNGLGNVYDDLGRYEDAVAAYRKAIELDEQFAYPWNSLGNVYDDLGRYEDAVAAYRKAIELDEQFAYPWNGLGNIYDDLGRYEDAVAAYRKAIDLFGRGGASPLPGAAYPWNNLGNVYADLGRYEDAVAAYRKAIALNEKYAYPWNNLGNVYRALGRYEDAVAAYRKAIALDAKFAAAWNNLGNVYRDLGRYEDAVAAYRKAIELDEKDAYPWYNLGLTYTLQGDMEAALEAFRKAVELKPEDGAYRSSLVGILRRLGREEEARREEKIARPLIEKEDEYNRACFAALCGDTEEALRLLAIALEKRQESRDWARQDPDFESLRADPRFWALVGAE